ncbi:hypothetical protein Pint_24763 [Pistacia integerrima]|uniref:Uncharacterized protein n=1 Tax=Pistacia integerrima TaxID=434235 RepID=A0ACC0YI05_9ROSI|nr:hypothetical protein Pint_24763 [Pistacia integerrima]
MLHLVSCKYPWRNFNGCSAYQVWLASSHSIRRESLQKLLSMKGDGDIPLPTNQERELRTAKWVEDYSVHDSFVSLGHIFDD